MAKNPKPKSKAIVAVPQSREEAIHQIGEVGTLRRRIQARRDQGSEALKEIVKVMDADIEPLAAELEAMERGVQTWCEANRVSLTNGGRVKFAQLATGIVRWRSQPPKVSLKGVDAVLERLKALGLTQFVRTKEEVNKDAMLADPVKARAVPGVTIGAEGEDFVIEPLEVDAAERKVA